MLTHDRASLAADALVALICEICERGFVRESPRVLFVSKPMVPPWHDGSKNLVRDIAANLARARPTVMSVEGAPSLGPRVVMEPVYRDAGRFAPGLFANARVVSRLLRGDTLDLWAFCFAPNPMSSTVANIAMRARRATGFRGRVIQMIPSAPRSFTGVGRWLFGEHVVVLTEYTRGRLFGAGVSRRDVRVIPPCARAPRTVTDDEERAFRAHHDLGSGPVVVYPGDYEISRGAVTVARAIPRLLRAIPEARVVFACREKTPRSSEARVGVQRALAEAGLASQTRHVGEVDDMAVLLSVATAIAFPVDDLYGKVDIPLVLLEALAAGVPMVLVRGGPLEAVTSARLVDPGDDAALARELLTLLQNADARQAAVEAGRALYAARFTPRSVAAMYDDLFDVAARAMR
jgi:glycosyltransferase involved in cell wall biosynthesis